MVNRQPSFVCVAAHTTPGGSISSITSHLSMSILQSVPRSRELIQSSSPSHASACGVTIGELLRFKSVTSFIPNSTISHVPTISAKPVGVGTVSQRLIPTGERSGLQTHIAVTESVSSPDERRNLNELAFERDRREWDKRNLLPFQVPFAQLNRKTLRWEEVSQALMRHEKKARPEHDLAFLGEIAPIESIYFPV